jgi:hypothetical protein
MKIIAVVEEHIKSLLILPLEETWGMVGLLIHCNERLLGEMFEVVNWVDFSDC